MTKPSVSINLYVDVRKDDGICSQPMYLVVEIVSNIHPIPKNLLDVEVTKLVNQANNEDFGIEEGYYFDDQFMYLPYLYIDDQYDFDYSQYDNNRNFVGFNQIKWPIKDAIKWIKSAGNDWKKSVKKQVYSSSNESLIRENMK